MFMLSNLKLFFFRSMWNERHGFIFCYSQDLPNITLNFLPVSFILLVCSRMSISQSSPFNPTNKMLFIIHFSSSTSFFSPETYHCRKARNKKEMTKGKCYRFWQGKLIISDKCLWPQNNTRLSRNILPKFKCRRGYK